MEELKSFKDKVVHVLQKYPESRNSDKELLKGYIIEHHPELLIRTSQRVAMITLDDLMKLPNFETLRRNRQVIQNDNELYRPTSSVVLNARANKEKNYRHAEVRETKAKKITITL